MMTLHPAARRAALVALLLALTACDPVTRHQVLVSVLDGYPTLPPVQELCRDNPGGKGSARSTAEPAAKASPQPAAQHSEHRPFQQKRCNDCHQADKGGGAATDEGLLVKPREELCFVCHKDLLSKRYQHGPASVGDCLACHLPHDAQNPSLLVLPKETLCGKCHVERRRAARMHDLFVEKGLACATCHDPHSGDTLFFLK